MLAAMNDVNAISSIPGALQSATSAIQKAVKGLANDANTVAQSGDVMSKDVLPALVDSRQQVLYTQAAAKLIAASDEMTQSLLDVTA
jgi:hypothetical protein